MNQPLELAALQSSTVLRHPRFSLLDGLWQEKNKEEIGYFATILKKEMKKGWLFQNNCLMISTNSCS